MGKAANLPSSTPTKRPMGTYPEKDWFDENDIATAHFQEKESLFRSEEGRMEPFTTQKKQESKINELGTLDSNNVAIISNYTGAGL